jgi:hypothetical protein
MKKLDTLEAKFSKHNDIYFHRELLGESLEKRRVDLITISDRTGITKERDELIPDLFPQTTGDKVK